MKHGWVAYAARYPESAVSPGANNRKLFLANALVKSMPAGISCRKHANRSASAHCHVFVTIDTQLKPACHINSTKL
jgi:hypothetical protein